VRGKQTPAYVGCLGATEFGCVLLLRALIGGVATAVRGGGGPVQFHPAGKEGEEEDGGPPPPPNARRHQ